MTERPENFVLKHDHALARGLVFAGLGQSPGSVRYIESSKYGNHGTLTNMKPESDWSNYLGRKGLRFAASSSQKVGTIYGTGPAVGVGGCAWFHSWSFPDYGDKFTGFTIGNSYGCGIGTGYSGSVRRCLWAGVRTSHNIPNWTNVTRWWDPELSTWYHIGFIFSQQSPARTDLYINGKLAATATLFGSIATNGTNINLAFWEYNNIYMTGRIVDPMLWNKCQPSYFQQLADPSNAMLSGMLQPPKRKYYTIKNTPYSIRYFTLTTNSGSLSIKRRS